MREPLRQGVPAARPGRYRRRDIERDGVEPLQPHQLRLPRACRWRTHHTIDTLQALKKRGVKLSIDDFGTGYSSFSYLGRFPVDELKVDRSFIAKLGRNYEDTTLISVVVILGQSLGLKVVAEGVEKDYQLRPLRELGCDRAQWYYFSKPLPSHEMSAKLGLWRVAVVLDRAYLRAYHHGPRLDGGGDQVGWG